MEGDGLIDMIRTIALNEIGGDDEAQEWLDTNFNHPFVAGMLAAPMKKRWGVTDKWVADRFAFGDTSVEQLVLDLEEFTGEEGLSADDGSLANELAIAKRRSESLRQYRDAVFAPRGWRSP